MQILNNYYQLIARVEELCQGIQAILNDQITCRKGCSVCCTAITLFPVEAAALAAALDSLPAEQADFVRRQVAANAGGDGCPLLHEQSCLLYSARPIICRTHGYPIQFTENAERRIDCCPQNLAECTSLPGAAVVDLDRLNSVLVAVNALYLKEQPGDVPERITIADAILSNPGDKDA